MISGISGSGLDESDRGGLVTGLVKRDIAISNLAPFTFVSLVLFTKCILDKPTFNLWLYGKDSGVVNVVEN